jgi:hypothetical protein
MIRLKPKAKGILSPLAEASGNCLTRNLGQIENRFPVYTARIPRFRKKSYAKHK